MSAHPSEMSWVGTGSNDKLRWIALERLDKFVSSEFFPDVNLNKEAIYSPLPDATMTLTAYSPYGNDHKTPLPSATARAVRPSFAEMTSATVQPLYKPVSVGAVFGPSWSTHWLRVKLSVPQGHFPAHQRAGAALPTDPARATGLPAEAEESDEVHFLFDCNCEGLVWLRGEPRQAFTGGTGHDRRAEFILRPADAVELAGGSYKFDFYVEIGCNGMFGNAENDIIRSPNPLRTFTLATAGPRRFDALYHRLYWDFYAVANIAKELKDRPEGQTALRVAHEVINALRPRDPATHAAAVETLEAYLHSPAHKGGVAAHLHNNPLVAADLAAKLGLADEAAELARAAAADADAAAAHAACYAAAVLPSARGAAAARSGLPAHAAAAPATEVPEHAHARAAAAVPESLQRVAAVGHCHIDTAWLWPYAETRRKVARSWATQLELAAKYPQHRFAFSQAQQMEWLRQDYPELFARVCAAVKAGIFYPVGGTWIEQDANIPGSEAMVRQFTYGQRFFQEHFGMRSRIFWLPDTFGYCAQLPQILRGVGQKYFLTQKLSWNLINVFPYHSFLWRGIDGSQVLAHFPPTDTYTSNMGVAEVVKHQSQYRERAITRDSMLLFGNGDGGGGPTAEMLERLDRLDSAPGLPHLTLDSPEAMFERIETSAPALPRYDGELYLELHRGTYTTQAVIKDGNATLQQLLHDAEALSTLAATLTDSEAKEPELYPRPIFDAAWHGLLLNQFHDVLPGSCIHLIVEDAVEIYRSHVAAVAAAVARAAGVIARTFGFVPVEAGKAASGLAVINPLPFPRTEVIAVPDTATAAITATAALDADDDAARRDGSKPYGVPYPAVLSTGGDTAFACRGASAPLACAKPAAATGAAAAGAAAAGAAAATPPRLVAVTVPAMGVTSVDIKAALAAADAANSSAETGPAVVAYRDRITYLVPAVGVHAAARGSDAAVCAGAGAKGLVKALVAKQRARASCPALGSVTGSNGVTVPGESQAQLDMMLHPRDALPTHVPAAFVRGASLRFRRALARAGAAPVLPPCAAAAAVAPAGVALRAVTEDVIVLENELVRYEVSTATGRVVQAFDKRPAAAPAGSYRRILHTAGDDLVGARFRSAHADHVFERFAEGAAAIARGDCSANTCALDARAWEADGTPLTALGLSPAQAATAAAAMAAAATAADESGDAAARKPSSSPALSWVVTDVESASGSPSKEKNCAGTGDRSAIRVPRRAGAAAAVAATAVVAASEAESKSCGAAADAATAHVAAEAVLQAALHAHPGLTSRQVVEQLAHEVSAGGNALYIYSDLPLYWDAWDVELYHLQSRRPLTASSVVVAEASGLRGSVAVTYNLGHAKKSAGACASVGASAGAARNEDDDTLQQRLTLSAGSALLAIDCRADWRLAAHEMLKAEFPFAVRASTATYEIQFGSAARAAHTNSSIDLAKFEVCAQRWAAAGDGAYTVGLLTKAKHGFHCKQAVMSLSLLRSPTRPDDQCDLHVHSFALALAPYTAGVADCDITRDAQAFNAPLLALPVVSAASPNVAVSLVGSASRGRSVLVETVKLAETTIAGFEPDALCKPVKSLCIAKSGAAAEPSQRDVVLRAYESAGAATVATVWVLQAALRGAAKGRVRGVACNMLEETEAELAVDGPRDLTDEERAQAYGAEAAAQGAGKGQKAFSVQLPFRAFDIKTVRFTVSK